VSTEPNEYTRLVDQRASGRRTITRGIQLLIGVAAVVAAIFVAAVARDSAAGIIYGVLAAVGGGAVGTGNIVVGAIEMRDAQRQLRGLVPEARVLSERRGE
jgi:hypothetical protein